MNKAAVHYTTEELMNLVGKELNIEYIYNKQQNLIVGLTGTISEVRVGTYAPNMPASINFVPTEHSAAKQDKYRFLLPENISLLDIQNIIS